jgi:hypothetical protein
MLKLLKLITGETVIGQVEQQDDQITLDKAFQLLLTPEGNVLLPYLAAAEPLKIRAEHVICLAEPVAALVNAYAHATGASIVRASQQDLQQVSKLVIPRG